MKYKYAILTVPIKRGIRNVVVIENRIYEKSRRIDGSEKYDNYEFVGVIETDLESEELLDAISETGNSRAEYYKDRLGQIYSILKSTKF